MANEKNLKPFNKRTEREQREIARKGGKKSAEIRKEKKIFEETIRKCLTLKTPEKAKEELSKHFPELAQNDLDLKTAIIISLIKNILNGGKNSVQAFIVLRDTIGEKPIDKLDNINPSVIINNKMSFKDLQKLKKELDE